VVTCRVFLDAFLGIAAQFVLAIGVISSTCHGWASNCWTRSHCRGVRSADEGVRVVVGRP
jgi:hypothetical protein